jgi:hypothetical protein
MIMLNSLRRYLGLGLLGVMLATAVPMLASASPQRSGKKGGKKGGKRGSKKAPTKGGGRSGSK